MNAMVSMTPGNLKEAQEFARMVAKSHFIPKDYQNNEGNVLVAIVMGAELGLKPIQALQNIAVINGRPSLWGDAVKAIVMNSGLCESFSETLDEQNMTACCTLKRKDFDPVTVTFSAREAEQAKLWGKPGPWSQYPMRMLKLRARSFACRDAFPDLLRGLSIAEEAQDIPEEKNITPTDVKVKPTVSRTEEVKQKLLQRVAVEHEEVPELPPVDMLLEHLDQAITIEDCQCIAEAANEYPRGSDERKLMSKALKAKKQQLEQAQPSSRD
jgi:hypothetical protein